MISGQPRAIVLGSAAGGGYPQWNCRCRVCNLAWAGDPRVRPRTQSSLALTGNGREWILINASPDIRQQIQATSDLWPTGRGRHSPISAVILTSAEIDACAGLLTLRERQPFRLVATRAVHAALDATPLFEALDRALVERVVLGPDACFHAAGLTLRLIPLPGKAPLYAEGTAPEIGRETGETAGIMVNTGNGSARNLAYLPGVAEFSEAVLALCGQADPILFDGTLFLDDELVEAGLGTKTGRRMGHLPIAGPGGSLECLRRWPDRRKIYVHINNTNPILIDGSPERLSCEAAGIEVAHDGLEIRL